VAAAVLPTGPDAVRETREAAAAGIPSPAPGDRRPRRVTVRRLILAALAPTIAGAVLAAPSQVEAHAVRVSSVPGADAALPRPPGSVTITFDEEPDPLLSRIEVLDASGRQFQTGTTRTVPGDPHRLAVALGQLPPGVYTVAWTTLSAVDGHVAEGTFAFGVGVPPATVRALGPRPPPTAPGPGPGPSPAAVAARWCLYTGLVLVLGAAVVASAMVVGPPPRSSLAFLPAAWTAAALGTALTIGVQAREAGIPPAEILHTAMARSAVDRVATIALSGALVLAALLTRGSRQRLAVAAAGAGAAAAMLADVAASHAAAGALVAANTALQWVHIMAAGVWLGGLPPLLVALRGELGGVGTEAVRRFSALAAIALAALAVTGTIRAAVEIGAWERVTGTGYGRLVTVKAGLLAVLLCLGALNRFGTVPGGVRSLRGLRRVGSVEVAVATAALLAAASLVNLAPPAPAAVTAAQPPSPSSATAPSTSVAAP
jgi:copper transport protein